MATVDYLKVLKTAEQFTDDNTPWKQKFQNLVALSIKEQADAFKLRFALQFEKQGVDAREMVRKVNAVSEIFIEKSKEGNGKNMKYSGVEFGDIIKAHGPESQLTFMERKKKFKDFDLDNNGVIDICEFLLYVYKDTVVKGYMQRHELSELDTETEAEALIKEFVNIAVFIDPKLDSQILGIAQCKTKYEAEQKKLKEDAKTDIKKRQLTQGLKNLEKKHEDEMKGFYTTDRLGKAKKKMMTNQEKHLRDLEKSLDQEAADALKPKKNLKMPGK